MTPFSGTLLGSAERDTLVAFHPAHWQEMRRRALVREVVAIDDAVAVALDMSTLARTALIDGRPEAIVGLSLIPGGGAPWIMTMEPLVDRLARVVALSRPFIGYCLTRCPLLRSELQHTNSASALWFASLGFRKVSGGQMARWELERSAVNNGSVL